MGREMEDKDKEQRRKDTEKQQSGREGIGCCCYYCYCCCPHWRVDNRLVLGDLEVEHRWQSLDNLVEPL